MSTFMYHFDNQQTSSYIYVNGALNCTLQKQMSPPPQKKERKQKTPLFHNDQKKPQIIGSGNMQGHNQNDIN